MTTTTLRIGCMTMDWSLACKARCRDQGFKCEVDTFPKGGLCVKALTIAKGFWNIDKHLLYSCRGVRYDCGTALNEATTVMGYRV